MPKGDKFTEKQLKFIEAYEGNATQAARLAGYKGDDNAMGVQGNQLLRNPKIAAEIRKRQQERLKPLIATREERQRFWTEVMTAMKNGNPTFVEMKDRLKASELLGKSEKDFTEKIEHSGTLSIVDLVLNSMKEEEE